LNSAPDCFTPLNDLPSSVDPAAPIGAFTFSWQNAFVPDPLFVTYTLQISNDPAFPDGEVEIEISDLATLSHVVPGADLKPLTMLTTHFWRVIATSNAGNETISSTFTFTTQNRADFNNDSKVDGADLATLLSVWDTDGGETCADLNEDGVVNGADMAFLLANWTPESQTVMASSFGDDFEDSAVLTEPDAAPAASVSDVPWIIAHFGFTSLEDYVTWLGLIDDEQLTAHLLALLDLLLQGE